MKNLIIIFLLLWAQTITFAQKIPNVYQVGEHQDHYNKLLTKYESQFLTVCNNDMELAYEKWSELMINLEVFSKQEGVDIRGVKLWINIFFSKNGTIDYLIYHPKPNSLNMNYQKLAKIFDKFIASNKVELEFRTNFSHYGSAHFPVLHQLYIPTEK